VNITVIGVGHLDAIDASYIACHLCRDGSDFQTALRTGNASGDIAYCRDQGEIIGWARTEWWGGHQTLEAFVSPPYRGRSVSVACAQALVASGSIAKGSLVAVFRRPMDVIAGRCGLRAALFSLEGSLWTRVKPSPACGSARR
jgi:hypothetical protein